MTTLKTRTTVVIMDHWADEEEISHSLSSDGFDMEYTDWVYSWSPPRWMSPEDKATAIRRLEESDYHSYLVCVREEKPNA